MVDFGLKSNLKTIHQAALDWILAVGIILHYMYFELNPLPTVETCLRNVSIFRGLIIISGDIHDRKTNQDPGSWTTNEIKGWNFKGCEKETDFFPIPFIKCNTIVEELSV